MLKVFKLYLPYKSTYNFLGILLGLKSQLIRRNLRYIRKTFSNKSRVY